MVTIRPKPTTTLKVMYR